MKTNSKTEKKPTPYQRMLDDLAKSKLDNKDAKQLGFQPMTSAESTPLRLSRTGEGYKIPYFTPDGEPMSKMFRYRFFDNTVTMGFLKGAKLRKYDQPFGTSTEAYLPRLPVVDWEKTLNDSNAPLYFVEGEKKAACITKHIGPCIGLGGVFSFGGIDLLPSLRRWKWAERDVFIVFDADKVRKHLVRLAESRLAGALARLSAKVHIIDLPFTDGGPKGADDYIAKYGKEKFNKLPRVLFEGSRNMIELSAQYGLVRQGGMILEFPTEDHPEIRLHEVGTFRVIEAHRKIKRKDAKENTKLEPAVKEWLESPGKPTVENLTYLPNGPQITEKNEFNSWRPSGIEPIAGDTSLFDTLTEHLIPDKEERKYALQWAAYPLQCPGQKMNVAMLMWSIMQGNGKNLWGETIGLLHGRHNYTLINQEHLDSQFNSWLARRTFINGEEVCGERDSRALADKIKGYITDEVVWINEKNQPRYQLPNCAVFYLSSNHPNALFIDDQARRFFVVHAADGPLKPEFYTKFCAWRDAGGYAAILHKLLNTSLEGFNPKGHALRTQARADMVVAGRSDLQRWVHALKEDPASILTIGSNHVPVEWASCAYATAKELLGVYDDTNPKSRVNEQQLTAELKNAGFTQAHNGGQIRVSIGPPRVRLWVINQLKAKNINSVAGIVAEYERERSPKKPKKFMPQRKEAR